MHLCICRILNGMRDKYTLRVGHAQRIGLRRSGGNELRRSNRDRGHSLNFKPYRVMQTARGTGASVCQRLDYKVVCRVDFRSQRIRCWFRKGRLGVAGNFHLWQALLERFL